MPYTYDYPRPAVCVDAVVFTKDHSQILLIQRAAEPFKDMWALPGGFVDMDETLEQAVLRELEEETGLKEISLKQMHTYGDPGRDPRGRVISVVFTGCIEISNSILKPGSDAANAHWWDVNALPPLAFDHFNIISEAIKRETKH